MGNAILTLSYARFEENHIIVNIFSCEYCSFVIVKDYHVGNNYINN